jgi:hypothetical protein
MVDSQTLILAGTAFSLVLALLELRRLRASRVGWVIAQAGRVALAHPQTRTNRTARELLVIAARELADAVALRDLNAPAWGARARHLARTVQATESRRRRYQRANGRPTSLDRPGTRRVIDGQAFEDARLAVTA